MKSRRGALVLAAVALVALAVAVPVLARGLWTPGGSGTLTFVNVDQYGPDWQSVPPIDPRGPRGTMAYTASVLTTQTALPEQLVTFSFPGSRLCRGVEYALVNPFALRGEPLPSVDLDVYVLGYGRANRAGIVRIRGCAPLAHLNADPPQLGLSEVVDPGALVSGARLRLVPRALLHENHDPQRLALYSMNNLDTVLVSVLGVPLILPDNWMFE